VKRDIIQKNISMDTLNEKKDWICHYFEKMVLRDMFSTLQSNVA